MFVLSSSRRHASAAGFGIHKRHHAFVQSQVCAHRPPGKADEGNGDERGTLPAARRAQSGSVRPLAHLPAPPPSHSRGALPRRSARRRPRSRPSPRCPASPGTPRRRHRPRRQRRRDIGTSGISLLSLAPTSLLRNGLRHARRDPTMPWQRQNAPLRMPVDVVGAAVASQEPPVAFKPLLDSVSVGLRGAGTCTSASLTQPPCGLPTSLTCAGLRRTMALLCLGER